jgi:hypothetical protein
MIKEMKTNICIAVFLIFLPIIALSQPKKIALVIGNSKYSSAPLKNPINDANKMEDTLQKVGFTVLKFLNVDYEHFEKAIKTFVDTILEGDVILFYFSGHGSQVNGENYLIPINEKISSEEEIKYKSVNLNYIIDLTKKPKPSLKIYILDACRTNPYKGFKTTEQGLSAVYAPYGTIISYATSPGKVAYDGVGDNSPFAKNLISIIPKYGLKIEDVFKEVRKNVMQETNNKQIPWESTSLIGDFYFTTTPTYSSVYRPKVKIPAKRYYISTPNAYLTSKCPKSEIFKGEVVEIEYELLDVNLIKRLTPLFFKVYQRKGSLSLFQMFDDQYEIKPGKNVIKHVMDYKPGEYTIRLGVYFNDEVNDSVPTFYSKSCEINIKPAISKKIK